MTVLSVRYEMTEEFLPNWAMKRSVAGSVEWNVPAISISPDLLVFKLRDVLPAVPARYIRKLQNYRPDQYGQRIQFLLVDEEMSPPAVESDPDAPVIVEG